MLDVSKIVPDQRAQIKEIADAVDRMVALKDTCSVSELVYEIMMNEMGMYRKNLGDSPQGKVNIRLLNKFYGLCTEYESITRNATLRHSSITSTCSATSASSPTTVPTATA